MIYPFAKIPQLRKILSKKKVVFISGCFDVLHEGHIEFLKQAASLGDVLVVGVLSDRYIETHKRRDAARSQRDRAVVMQALKSVDHVILTPFFAGAYPSLHILHALRPTIFFRFENPQQYLPIKRELSEMGITLRSKKMKKINSTSAIISKFQARKK
jgi:cytidyltransferase-like protein